mmetsp:Transcript_97970/g.204365  ORF Transcript_97970/g.204365 Transcript_97970/m.204365 type:complete len:289 (+) Transcript_97970:61-927(+)|eukprot:CAMPEP_0206569384 /NCGR_PEP_ID=MMETSP0325_2-20121206/26409_1 /ASSEMBLY_ACC=CAM_ASM_000347 /TAXON_ID=2866 /ORGANISM="Crypthecodinium cohnii, Strain Seligo" /LENGTH=288 /DNA_ID=CAMNT_0054072969 /DNA_START=36 /DNA_END=902 /DNA_ORIENTATION=+
MSFYGTDAAEKSASKVVQQGGPKLDSSWKLDRQLKALAACETKVGKTDDLTFKESSIKDVTDRGRGQVVEALMEALEKAINIADEETRRLALVDRQMAKNLAGSSQSSSQVPKHVYDEVKSHREALARFRKSGRTVDQPIAECLAQLGRLPIDARVLKETKVALELNHEFWRKSPETAVRNYITELVTEWKNKFRAETGNYPEPKKKVYSQRALKNTATDLEGAAYNRVPRLLEYQQVIKAILTRFLEAPKQAVGIMEGGRSSESVVKDVHAEWMLMSRQMQAKRQRI